jgi:flagellar basal body rod protein FlgF
MAFSSVIDTPRTAVNNGVIVTLTNGSRWTVTGTSYLTSLTIDEGSTITAPKGNKVTMMVDGVVKTIEPGGYKGKIVLTVTKS